MWISQDGFQGLRLLVSMVQVARRKSHSERLLEISIASCCCASDMKIARCQMRYSSSHNSSGDAVIRTV